MHYVFRIRGVNQQLVLKKKRVSCVGVSLYWVPLLYIPKKYMKYSKDLFSSYPFVAHNYVVLSDSIFSNIYLNHMIRIIYNNNTVKVLYAISKISRMIYYHIIDLVFSKFENPQ